MRSSQQTFTAPGTQYTSSDPAIDAPGSLSVPNIRGPEGGIQSITGSSHHARFPFTSWFQFAVGKNLSAPPRAGIEPRAFLLWAKKPCSISRATLIVFNALVQHSVKVHIIPNTIAELHRFNLCIKVWFTKTLHLNIFICFYQCVIILWAGSSKAHINFTTPKFAV